jgi:maleylacetate reductase
MRTRVLGRALSMPSALRFTHESTAQRVAFAPEDAAAAVADEVKALGASRAMLIAPPRETALADSIVARLAAVGAPVVALQDEVVMHVPLELAERARRAAASAEIDVIVTIGGGSSTGLGKAVALVAERPGGLPIVSVPTTYSGSEATNVWGITESGKKTTGTDRRVLPRSIVYDAALLTSLPTEMAVASGLNALAHCVDAMWGPRVDPIDQALAAEGIRALAAGLPEVAHDGAALPGIGQTLYGAYLAAVAFSSAGSGMHHKICHVLGGMFDLPHAQTHAAILPHVLAFNGPNAPDAESRIARAFGTVSAADGLAALRAAVNAPRALKEYGMPEAGITQAIAPILAAIPADNPTPVTEANIMTLLRAAWEGDTR